MIGQLSFFPVAEIGKKRKAPKRAGCEVCPLRGRLQYRVQGDGNPNSRLYFIGEAPGEREAEKKLPFVGKSGQLLTSEIKQELGLDRSDCYFFNVVQCWPEDNRTPTKKERDACHVYLERELAPRHPTTVVALGESAFLSLLGMRGTKAVSRVRGREWFRKDGIKVLPTFHPAFLLRGKLNSHEQRLFRLDLRRALQSSKSRESVNFAKLAGYNVDVMNKRQLTRYLEWLELGNRWVATDIEATPEREPFLISFCSGGKRGFVVRLSEVKDLIPQFLRANKIRKVFQNGAKYDVPVLQKTYNTKCVRFFWDTFIAAVTLDSRKGRSNLNSLVDSICPELSGYDQRLEEYKKREGVTDYSKIPDDIILEYCGLDSVACAQVFKYQYELANHALVEFLMCYTLEVLVPMEDRGILVDEEYLEKMIAYLTDKRERYFRLIRQTAGDPNFNAGSPKQISELLFGKLKLPTEHIWQSEKTGDYSVNEEALEVLKREHKVVNYIHQFRKVEKDLKTYGVRIRNELVDKRFHIHYWLGGTDTHGKERGAETGRTSSNLQNLPTVDSENPKKYEPANVFIPDRGYVFLIPDYSQIELRMTAFLSQDRRMLDGFNKKNLDAHAATCVEVLGWDVRKPIPKMVRREAKGINFAKVFGATPKGLALNIGCSVEKAHKLLLKDMRVYPGYWKWRREQVYAAAEKKYVETIFGWRRPLSIPDEWQYRELELEHWQRQAINTPVQGPSGQLLEMAQLLIARQRLERCYIVMNGHDSTPLEVPVSKVDEYVRIIKEIMEEGIVSYAWKRFRVDISGMKWKVEFELGERLGTLRKLGCV